MLRNRFAVRVARSPQCCQSFSRNILAVAICSFVIFIWLRPVLAYAQDEPATVTPPKTIIAPPSNLTATDAPDDAGTAIDLKWAPSADDDPARKPRVVRGYQVYRSLADGSDRSAIARLASGAREFTDNHCQRGQSYFFEVTALGDGNSESEPARLEQPVRSVVQWFDTKRRWFGVIVLVVCGCVIVFTEIVKSGRGTYIRPIAGLKAIQEALGRATEMGRPCLFVPGLRDMNEISTVAGINVLSHVARIAADYDATIEVPTSRSLVMTAAREAVQAAYLAAGRSDAFNDDRITYVTEEQFAYVAYLTGYMVREQPAACFYMGTFFAESLILAETGNSIGAIQIAGTNEAAQLPFFVAACDYTLIGEELFAASAYLSGEPHQLGSLKGQDAGKVLACLLLVAGCVLATLATLFPESKEVEEALGYLTESILGRRGT
jgi:hypothetical protein